MTDKQTSIPWRAPNQAGRRPRRDLEPTKSKVNEDLERRP